MRTVTADGLILASASPRRAELLASAGIAFEVHPADVDERVRPGESAEAYVRRVAGEKCLAVMARFPGRPVLAADTTVVVAGEILGKPIDTADATRMLRLLSGRAHQVITGVALGVPGSPGSSGTRIDPQIAATTVWFVSLGSDEIAWYIRSGEPMDKAGAYAVQGLGGRFVERLEGSYSNVVGLPVALVYRMCTAAGILLS